MAQPTRNTQLDGLRGYAAMAVVTFHTLLDRDPTLDQRIVRPPLQDVTSAYDAVTKLVFMLVSGETAVILFFVLSGLVLFESLRARHAGPTATALGFCVRRVFRLYPTFFACLGAALGAFAITGALAQQAPHFWPNAALYDFSVLGASWTLQIEFLAVPFILVGFWAHRRFGAWGIVGTYALFTLLLREPHLRMALIRYDRFLSCFALGMLIPTQVGATAARWLTARAWPFVLVALFLMRHVAGLHWWTMKPAQILAALLIALLYHHRAGALGRIFDRPVSQYFGRISYSLYLSNVSFLILTEHWTRDLPWMKEHPLEWGLALAIPTVGASILTAHVIEFGLERPSIWLGRRLTRWSLGPEIRAAG